jgi:hypothetical protein
MSRSLKFASLLADELRNSRVDWLRGRCYRVNGRLDTGVIVVGITIEVPWLFRDLKRKPPEARCLEPWMKTGADWHNGRLMCWVLPNQWRDAMNWRGKPVKAILNEGRTWTLNGVRCLVNRHYSAYLDGLTAWPAEWAEWSHGIDGVREYERERNATISIDRCNRPTDSVPRRLASVAGPT